MTPGPGPGLWRSTATLDEQAEGCTWAEILCLSAETSALRLLPLAAQLLSQAKATVKILSVFWFAIEWIPVHSRFFTSSVHSVSILFYCYLTLSPPLPHPFFRTAMVEMSPPMDTVRTKKNHVCIGAMNLGPLIDTSWLITGGKRNNSITPSSQLEQMRKCVW